MNYLTKAIFLLKPNSEFVYENDDYSTIVWHKLDGNAPTIEEIDAAIKLIKENEAEEKRAKATAKADLLEKLGITEEEAKLLLA